MAAVAIGVIGLTIFGIVATAKSGRPEWLFLSLPFTLMFFLLGRFAPSGYRLAGEGVHIERRIGDKVIPYRDIRTVDRLPRSIGGLSVFGSRGVFGRFGRFWNPNMGLHRLYITNGDTLVWLTTEGGWIALSPDRPDEFVERLNARLGLLR